MKIIDKFILEGVIARLEKILSLFESNNFDNMPVGYWGATQAHIKNLKDLISDLKEFKTEVLKNDK